MVLFIFKLLLYNTSMFRIAICEDEKVVLDFESSLVSKWAEAANLALELDTYISAEQFLFEYRLRLLDDLRPLDGFSIDAVYAYGIKLLLVERMKKFEVENGKTSYHEIYDTILSNE